MGKVYLDIAEVSHLTGFAVPTIYGYVHSRKIPFIRKGGRLRFDRERIEAWMEADAYEVVADVDGP